MTPKTGFFNPSYPAQAWVYFLLFTAANAALSYAPLGLTAKLWIFLFGVLLPLAQAFRSMPGTDKKEKSLLFSEIFQRPPGFLWFLILALGCALRLGMVWMPGNWPTFDDSRVAFYSVELLNHWHWVFFLSNSQYPALLNWIMAAYFHLVPPSVTSLWLFPALFSLGGLLLSWVLVRRLFSPSFGFIFILLMAFSFWPLYAGKFCGYMASLVFWEFLVLALLAFWIKSNPPQGGGRMAFLLGLAVGLGFWVSTSWPVVALVVSFVVAVQLRRGKKHWAVPLITYGIPVLAFLFLFGWASLHFRNSAHLGQLWALGGQGDPLRRWMDSASNLTALFWGCDLQNSYGPVWGGVLNPLEGACFFLGTLECWRFRRQTWARLLAVAFLVLFAPGMLTKNFDLFRNMQLLPVLLLVTVLGVGRLLLSLPSRNRWWALGLVLSCSLLLDLRHVLLTFPSSSSPTAKAFAYLKTEASEKGPGFILFELRPHEPNPDLSVATYSFNATANPRISLGEVHWMGIVVDADYRPFLERRFPGSQWSDLYDPAHPDPPGSNLVLGILPLGEGGKEPVENWRRANAALRDAVWTEANVPEDGDRREVFTQLEGMKPLFGGDPFLESLYWEWVFKFHIWENAYGDRNRSWHNPAALRALREGLRQGYPTAFFYNEWGAFLALQGDIPGARKAFEAALHCPVNLTPAAENLKALGAMGRSPAGGK